MFSLRKLPRKNSMADPSKLLVKKRFFALLVMVMFCMGGIAQEARGTGYNSTTTTMDPVVGPFNYGNSITFTAYVTGQIQCPCGPAYIVVDGNDVGSTERADTAGGAIQYTTSSLPAGNHTVYAAFRPTGVNIPSQSTPQNFTINATAPIVTTNAATSITSADAALNGVESSKGASTTATFEFGLDTSYGSSATATQSPLAAGASGASISAAVSNLTCNTTYHFRAKGVNNAGTTNGSDANFTTLACPAISFLGSKTTLNLRMNASATDIKSLLHVSASGSSLTETWTESVAPNHGGTLSFSNATADSGSSDITPGGTITYTPALRFVGTETFTVQVSDGTATVTRQITVTVIRPGLHQVWG